MSCSTGHIARGGLVLHGSTRFVRFLRTCGLSRGQKARNALPVSTQHCAGRGYANSFLSQTYASSRHRPTRWGCRLTTSCQVAASSPHAATVQAAEKKQTRKSGGVVALPTTDESAELDRIRHSVSMIMYCTRTKQGPVHFLQPQRSALTQTCSSNLKSNV